ncbi:MAG: relaxase/mobilization nuclease domain-containing protein [Phenylobacterium sp.]|uniref:relaxase/mobilization nuclease domain-containing protein n=1 Tax=Phenylobacterium sp. TaxID=1871053 RepID=UPI0025E50BAF|nr:relaxase/mobilization nuclease domain-containing protein [Phenylobacterium sp.]MBI1198970.1 relaxase/mobilization nuclease domain-containing protein [Phenylobacterium sp.]
MSDFQTVHGFEDVWRPPVRPRAIRTATALRPGAMGAGQSARARLTRIASRAPEVMVKVTGRTRDGAHLRAHLDYISRNGQLDLEGPDGALVVGKREVAELARDWATAAEADNHRRANSPVSLSVILSMPAGTNEIALRDAARAFAIEIFADQHDYVFTVHTDTPRPHAHLSVCAHGRTGERLNPKKADLETWRQTFAQALRDRGVEAEATPRRARGVTLKAEWAPLRKIRERHEAGLGEPAQVRRSAYREAAKAAFRGGTARPVWEDRTVARQAKVRGLYLAQAKVLGRSANPADQALGAKVEAFVRSMPQPDSQRLALARELRAANAALDRNRPDDGRERGR